MLKAGLASEVIHYVLKEPGFNPEPIVLFRTP